MAFLWQTDPEPGGVIIRCLKKGIVGRAKPLAIGSWPSDNGFSGCGLLRFLVESERAQFVSDGVLLPYNEVAELLETQAMLIGLPPSIPHALHLRSHGTLDEENFAVTAQWRKFGQIPVKLRRTGAIAEEGDKRFRIPRPLLDIIDAIDSFNLADTKSRERRVEYWLPIQDALEAATGTRTQPDGYLGDLKIFHAASLSLSVDISSDRGITFDPVLFGRAAVVKRQGDLFEADPLADPAFDDEDDGRGRNGVDTLLDETDQLLPPALQKVFIERRFESDEPTREAYALQRNTFVVIDPPLRRALDVIKQKRRASESERREFVKNPRPSFAAALGVDDDSAQSLGIFVETQQYTDRVTGIGLWTPKVIPWLPKSPNTWLPEKIGFRIGDRTVEVAPEHLDSIETACKTALAAGQGNFSFGEVSGIPASEETLAAITALRETAEHILRERTAKDQSHADEQKESGVPTEKVAATVVLEADDNIDELRFEIDLLPRAAEIEDIPPKDLIDPERLFPHQREGFDWMVRGWISGRPGVLLADDMGLGKTIQTLAFAAWLHTHFEATGKTRGPFLIVAPTALLRNWKEEHDKHLRNGGIGPIVELYGNAVGRFRKEGEAGRDVVAGHGVLDRDQLAAASVILTTYETLANYHISFAAIRFPLVIFDEIQKLKTPTTINTHAAKTLNADFVLGLTGTPVENSLAELWSIMDRLHPGLLEDLKTFSRRFTAENEGSLHELQGILTHPGPKRSSVMLRRMKDTTDLGRALPERTFHTLPREMPDLQARAYESCIVDAQRDREEGSRGRMLKALQRMRSISLHPENPLAVLGQHGAYDGYIQESARLCAAIDTLDQIHDRGEKALVFIELRGMQELFADIIRHRYGLRHLPSIINGQTPSARRQDLVDRFQKETIGEFEVMILSPRAAGVGLTITAANHVVHLSRWWNPAVEDQCNDRAYRIGQDKKVAVYLPIARHPAFGDSSFDVSLDRLLARKRKLSRDLLVPVETEDDYKEMFEATVGA